MVGTAAIAIELAEDERAELRRWTRRRKTSQALATRAGIVLAAADGLNNAPICERLGVFLDDNGGEIEAPKGALYDLTIGVATGAVGKADIAVLFREYAV